jgi:hypothetical protein
MIERRGTEGKRQMSHVAWLRMLSTIGAAMILAGLLYLWHPGWFSNDSVYSIPPAVTTPTAGVQPTPAPAKPTPTPQIPRVGMTEHLDNVWITLRRLDHSQGGHGILPNLGDEFLIAYLHIENRSESAYRISLGDFQVLDSHGQIDPPLLVDFTRRRLREVSLVPGGHSDGTLIFEAPKGDLAAQLVYQPDVLSPSKHKVWLLK